MACENRARRHRRTPVEDLLLGSFTSPSTLIEERRTGDESGRPGADAYVASRMDSAAAPAIVHADR
jgi:hypothetical protein